MSTKDQFTDSDPTHSQIDLQTLMVRKKELQLVFETISDGLVIQDSNGKILQFNPATLSILGVTEHQLMGKKSVDLGWKAIREDGSDFPAAEHPGAVALRTGKKIHGVVLGLNLPSGECRWVRVNATPYESDGNPAQGEAPGRHVLITFSDVTELQRLSSDMRHIFSHSMDLICIASTDGTFKRVSPSFTKILGFEEQDLLTKPINSFIHPDDLTATGKIVAALSQGIPLVNFENRYRTKSGDYRRISWVCEPDTATGLLYATGRDVTELKNQEYKNQQILDAMNQTAIVAFTDPKGEIVEVNDNFCTISGYSREELIGRDHRILNSGRHPKTFFKDMWSTLKSGKSWTSDIENRKKSGEHYVVRSVLTPIKNTNGVTEEYVAIRFDVTELRDTQVKRDLAEVALAAKAREMQKLIDGGPVFLSHWDADLKNLAANAGYTKPFGKTPDQMVGTAYQDLLGPIFPSVKPFIDRALAGETSTTRTEITLKSGEVRSSQVTFQPDVEDGQVKGIFTVAIDITEEVQMRKALEQERAKSLKSAKLASLGEMSAGIAHEINNPLAIIDGSIELLQKYADDPTKFSAKVTMIKKSCERIAKIVNGLRKFSRSGEQTSHKIHSLPNIIKESLILVEAKSKRHHTPITLDCRSNANVNCDEVEIEQVLVNLLNNAVDAVKSYPQKWVKISVKDDLGSVVMRITDSGPGIPEGVRNKLFDPFFTTKKVGEGTGLGLSIAKGILDEHKASITVISDCPNTCFEIRFPRPEAITNAAS